MPYEGDLTWVQLGHVEVDPAVLMLDGVPLQVLVADALPAGDVMTTETRNVTPTHGWRVISSNDALGGRRMLTLAAPQDHRTGGWLLASLVEHDGQWSLTTSSRPEFPKPGKAFRRRGLRLSWPDAPVVALAGRVPSLTATLTNTAEASWRSEAGDVQQVLAWIVDGASGQPLPGGWFVYGGADRAELAGGESIELAATIATKNVDELPPGEYGLIALLLGIDLRSDPGHLHLI